MPETIQEPDGTTEAVTNEGGGNVEIEFSDGVTVQEHADGSSETIEPDGEVIEQTGDVATEQDAVEAPKPTEPEESSSTNDENGDGNGDGNGRPPNGNDNNYEQQVRDRVGDPSQTDHVDEPDHADAIDQHGNRIEAKVNDNELFNDRTANQLNRYRQFVNDNSWPGVYEFGFQYWFQNMPDPDIVALIRAFGGAVFFWNGDMGTDPIPLP